jgi:hypothetical protein
MAGGIYVYNSVYTESGSTFTSLAGDYGGAIRLDTGTLSLTNSVFSTVRAYIGGTIYLKDQVTVTINGITVTDSEGRYYGGFLYATGSLNYYILRNKYFYNLKC